MTDRHKRPPVCFRPAEDDHQWLTEQSAATGRPVSAILAEALAAYRAAAEGSEACSGE